MTGKPSSRTPRSSGSKLPYQKPRLKVYGDLRQITLAKGGSANDGRNVPVTKK